MAKWKTQYNATQYEGEKVDPVSLTVPDQTMSIQEILIRHAQGLPISASQRVPMYMSDGDDQDDPRLAINPNTLDLSERQQLMKELREEIRELRSEKKEKPEPKKSELQELTEAIRETLPAKGKDSTPAPSAGNDQTPPTK